MTARMQCARRALNRPAQAHTAWVKQQQAMFRQASTVDARRLGEKRNRPSPPPTTEPAP